MFSYTVYYFDKYNRFIAQRTILSPGDNVTSVQKLIRENYWDHQSISPAETVTAVAICKDHEPVMVVKQNA